MYFCIQFLAEVGRWEWLCFESPIMSLKAIREINRAMVVFEASIGQRLERGLTGSSKN